MASPRLVPERRRPAGADLKISTPTAEMRELRKWCSDEFPQFPQFPLLEGDFEKSRVDLPPPGRSSRSRHLHRYFAQPTGAHQHVEQGPRLAGVKPLCQRLAAHLLT